ncbi:MAG: DUF3108 domain-containing protein [Proteobacteria bacterium]|jgi:hypothetical protein|nr:MAG: DUF3108 domain-containing protein [Pseudomonadota bacterium]
MPLKPRGHWHGVWLALVGVTTGLIALGAHGLSARADGWPASVKASYQITFNGFNIGTLDFQSEAESESYTLVANTRLSVLLGAFTWDSETRSFGMLTSKAPKPAAFSLDFKSTLKAGSLKIGFSDGAVTDVAQQPIVPPKPGTIPLREQHLKGVLDPLSAIMMLSRGSNAHPCERRIPIFDGKERFDLVLSRKGEVQVTEQQPSGQPDVAYVCRVKYQPIAGYKLDRETEFMASNDAIEVALRPIPSANVFIPYQATIPTLAGYASVYAKRVEIVSPGKPQIALTH